MVSGSGQNPGHGWRDRRGKVLFIDARKLGHMADRTRQEFSDEDIALIAGTYHAWRGEPGAGVYEDVEGFCKAAEVEELKAKNYVLTPARYLRAAGLDDDSSSFSERLSVLEADLRERFSEARRLEAMITERLRELSNG